MTKNIGPSTHGQKQWPWLGQNGSTYSDLGRQGAEDSKNPQDLIEEIPEPEPKWRPFANLGEAWPFFDERLRAKETGAVLRINGIGDKNALIGMEPYSYARAFATFERINGTPFGIEVTE